MRPAIEVWRKALDATGAFIRFRDKPEQKAASVIESDRAEVRAELVAEIVQYLQQLDATRNESNLIGWAANRVQAEFGGRDA